MCALVSHSAAPAGRTAPERGAGDPLPGLGSGEAGGGRSKRRRHVPVYTRRQEGCALLGGRYRARQRRGRCRCTRRRRGWRGSQRKAWWGSCWGGDGGLQRAWRPDRRVQQRQRRPRWRLRGRARGRRPYRGRWRADRGRQRPDRGRRKRRDGRAAGQCAGVHRPHLTRHGSVAATARPAVPALFRRRR